jgi:DNA-binding PadR family transcriptional regulator
LQKNGIVKVWWEEGEQEEYETYYDLTEDQFAALALAVEMSDGGMKIAEHTVNNEDEAAEPVEESEATS